MRKCSVCKKPIPYNSGPFMMYNDEYFCDDCAKKPGFSIEVTKHKNDKECDVIIHSKNPKNSKAWGNH